MSHKPKPTPLYQQVEQTAKRYFFETLGDAHTHDVYATFFLAEFEKPLLIAALNHTHGNQSKNRPNPWHQSWHITHQNENPSLALDRQLSPWIWAGVLACRMMAMTPHLPHICTI